MKILMKIIYAIFSLILLIYMLIPSPSFPEPPAGSLQSDEPGDTEDINRRAYFTNQTRKDVVDNYYKIFTDQFPFSEFMFLTLRLNYPPEDAKTIIRDQTRSTYLEEIAHPMRESVFINGFEPKTEKDAILINGSGFQQKITVKLITGSAFVRILTGIAVVVLIPVIFSFYYKVLADLINKTRRFI